MLETEHWVGDGRLLRALERARRDWRIFHRTPLSLLLYVLSAFRPSFATTTSLLLFFEAARGPLLGYHFVHTPHHPHTLLSP